MVCTYAPEEFGSEAVEYPSAFRASTVALIKSFNERLKVVVNTVIGTVQESASITD
jgi:hypothetical protein